MSNVFKENQNDIRKTSFDVILLTFLLALEKFSLLI